MKLTAYLKRVHFTRQMVHAAAVIIRSMDSPERFMINLRDLYEVGIIDRFYLSTSEVTVDKLKRIGLKKFQDGRGDYVKLSTQDIVFSFSGLEKFVELGNIYFSESNIYYRKVAEFNRTPMYIITKLTDIKREYEDHLAYLKLYSAELDDINSKNIFGD